MKWRTMLLEAIKAPVPYAFVGGPFGSNLTTRDYVEDGVPVIRGNNLPIDSLFREEDFVFVSEKKAADLRPNTAYPGDLVFTQRGTLGQVGLIPREASYQRYILSQSQMKLTVNPEIADAHFVYYFFRQPSIVQKVINYAITSGVPHINLGILKEFKITLPEIDYQKRATDILSTYDDLIDTNRRRIQLLEESARLLFREWFVYFRFPRLRQDFGGQAGHEKVKIVDGMPERWKREKLNKFISFFGGHAFKSTSYHQEGKYGIVTIKNVQQGSFIPECTDYLDETPNAMKKHCFLSNGDILISLTGNVGRVCLVYGENYLLNQRVAKIESKNKIPKSFIYWMFDNPIMQKGIENLSYGSAQQNLSPIKLGEQTVILPSDPLLELFDEIVSVINIEIIVTL